MTTVDHIACDGLSCRRNATPEQARNGWMSLTITELAVDQVFTRHADLCPVHAQALLDICGPLPRRP